MPSTSRSLESPRTRAPRAALAAALAVASLATACSRERALSVEAEEARACDVLLDVGDAKSPAAAFAERVRGASSHHGARLGVSWVASGDAPFGPRAVTLRGVPAPKLLTSTCYDRDGRPIADPMVTLR